MEGLCKWRVNSQREKWKKWLRDIFSTCLAIRGVQVKTTLRIHPVPVTMPKMKKTKEITQLRNWVQSRVAVMHARNPRVSRCVSRTFSWMRFVLFALSNPDVLILVLSYPLSLSHLKLVYFRFVCACSSMRKNLQKLKEGTGLPRTGVSGHRELLLCDRVDPGSFARRVKCSWLLSRRCSQIADLCRGDN